MILFEDMILFLYIYTFAFLGAFSKDMLDIFLGNICKILIFKIFISSLAVAILLYGFSEYLLDNLSYRFFSTICYVAGVISFEFMTKYHSIQKVGSLIDLIYKIKYDKNKDKG